jgi:hypothetical protein
MKNADDDVVRRLLGTQNAKTLKIMNESYFSEEQWKDLCSGTVQVLGEEHPLFVEPISTQFRSLLRNGVRESHPWVAVVQKFFTGPLKKKPLTGVLIGDAETRNKIMARLYFLHLLFESPFECSSKLAGMYGNIADTRIGSNFVSANMCMNKILNRLYPDRLPVKDQNSQIGTRGLALYLVEIIVGYNDGPKSFCETSRFLNKLPLCKGDLSKGYVADLERESVLKKKQYKPFSTATVDGSDIEFIVQVLIEPTKTLYDSIIPELIKSLCTDVRPKTTLQKRHRDQRKTYSNHITRQVSVSWMKIVNAVGSVVHPTAATNRGKPKPNNFGGVQQKNSSLQNNLIIIKITETPSFIAFQI